MSNPGRTDEARFEDLYQRTRRDLLAYLVRRAQSPDDAADILAETYLVAWKQLETIPPGDNARLWLFGVGRNLLLKSTRQRRVGDALVERLAGELRAAEPATHPPSTTSQRCHLQAGLAALTDQDREILTLAAWEDLTPRQIAKAMNMSANVVRVRLHRARKRLSQELDRGYIGKPQFPPLPAKPDR
jgi:RNA polymerase sigma-70 factor, ECF subfamily